MEDLSQSLAFFWTIRLQLLQLTGEHLTMALTGIVAGAAVAIPLGIWVARHPRLGTPIIDLAGMLYTVPSLALLGFLIPFLGLGAPPAIAALLIYALLPLLRNTYVGISEVDIFAKEAAIGMGATPNQLLWRVELPLALPFILAGLRTVSVLTIGITTLGALVGAGGLGVLIFQGMHMLDTGYLLAGTLPVAVMAVAADHALGAAENSLRRSMGTENNATQI
ncbi:MAG: ABC transporter permease [Negativicutes bacterium]|nr:ABC transporter permease [Negativicutes bacterium]